MSHVLRSGAALTLLAVLSTTADAQDTRRPSPPLGTEPTAVQAPQEMSWYPHALRPPFVSESLEAEDVAEGGYDVVFAGNAVIAIDDPPRIPPALEKPLRRDGAFDPGYFIVHFESPLDEAEREQLDRIAGRLQRADGTALSRWYLPGNGVVVDVRTEAQYRALRRLEHVDWVDRYQPAYKLDATIGTARLTSPERVGRSAYRLNVDLMPGQDFASVTAGLRELGAVVLNEVAIPGKRTYDQRFVVVDAAPAIVTLIAGIEGVRTIQEAGDGLATYDLSGGGKLQNRSVTADDGSASPIVTTAGFPLWRVHDLQGQGQLIGIVDTNFDWNNTGTAGCGTGFPDTAISNWGMALPNLARVLLGSVGSGGVNLKIPRADNLGGAQLGSSVSGEHGMGAAGAAAGDFYANDDQKWWEHDVDSWESWAPTNYSGLLGPGIAHEAQLYLTPVMDTSNGFRWEFAGEFPANMSTTLNNMAAAGVATTNHSVGLSESSNTYTQTTIAHDTAAFDNQDMLQCMAAGNSGATANALTSQAVAKNGLAVGASDDVLLPENRASFSSIGPRFDGAIKPDVMAPGTDGAGRAGGVQSLLILPDSNGSGGGSCSYQWTSGTSFASPTMAGAGALVHQYFEEGRYPGNTSITDPSAALMKAVLINAGHRLTGANLGNGQYPNSYQGWGEPNLSDALDFGTGSRRLIASDVASSAGFTSAGNTPDTVTFNVNGTSERLRVTLAWTDEPGSAGQGRKLINDLDLRVTAPGGAVYRGNVINGSTGLSTTGGSADTLNNVENVILASPATGAWTATIDPGLGNYSVGQGYALVITGDVAESGGGPAAPTANFSASPVSGTAPLSVNFSDLSSGSINTWAWTFGDGGTSNAASPSHLYTSPGNYTVSLTVTGPGGSDTNTMTNLVTVNAPPTGGGLYYMSFLSNTVVPGVGTVRDEDVVTYDPATDTWALYFDGSDVGIGGTDVNALHVLDDGDLVLSFNSSSYSVPGLVGGPAGTTVEDSDLVIFSFTQSGPNTAGSFSFVFDGSDVGLTTNGEDIDGVYEFPGGGLALSTLGSAGVAGVSGVRDEDVLLFSATQYGATTAGTWSMHFDGSDVGFSTSSGEDLAAVTFDAGGDMLFSTAGPWSAAGGAGDDEDVGRFAGNFGASTSGTASLELDLSALGIDPSEDIDGLTFVP